MKQIRTKEGKSIYKVESFKEYAKTFGKLSLLTALTPVIVLKQALDVLEGENFIDAQIENYYNFKNIFEFIFTGKYTDNSIQSSNAIKNRKMKKSGATKKISNIILSKPFLKYKSYQNSKKKKIEIDFNSADSWSQRSRFVFKSIGKKLYKVEVLELRTESYKELEINTDYIFDEEMIITIIEEIIKREKL